MKTLIRSATLGAALFGTVISTMFASQIAQAREVTLPGLQCRPSFVINNGTYRTRLGAIMNFDTRRNLFVDCPLSLDGTGIDNHILELFVEIIDNHSTRNARCVLRVIDYVGSVAAPTLLTKLAVVRATTGAGPGPQQLQYVDPPEGDDVNNLDFGSLFCVIPPRDGAGISGISNYKVVVEEE